MADLGVPQHRERLIVMGVRRDLGVRPPVVPTPYAGRQVTVREALDLNPLPDDAPNHERGLDSREVVERLKLIPPGSNYEVIPAGHPHAVKGLISHVYRRLDPDKPCLHHNRGRRRRHSRLPPRRAAAAEQPGESQAAGLPRQFRFRARLHRHGPAETRRYIRGSEGR